VLGNILRLEQAVAAYAGDPGSLTWALSITGDIQRELIQQELCDTGDLYGNQTPLTPTTR